MDADVLVIGGGLAGLVACAELTAAGKRVLLVEQENAANLGGQAFWSFGGLFLVDTPEQRCWGIRDSAELAWQDWRGSAQWDRLDDEDRWGAVWGEAYVAFAAGEKRAWLEQQGVRFTPLVGWAERGDGRAGGHGNSVPRFHLPWGTGTGVSGPFAAKARAAAAAGQLGFRFRHRVDGLVLDRGAVTGVHGAVLAPDEAARGVATNRREIREFVLTARAVVVASGGIGANHDLVRAMWPARLGSPPATMLTGVPAHVDGRMLGIAEEAGARVVNKDRMWHYTEGVANWDPIWAGHGIRILPGPSSMWFDALGRRLPAPGIPGHDTLGTLRAVPLERLPEAFDAFRRAVQRSRLRISFPVEVRASAADASAWLSTSWGRPTGYVSVHCYARDVRREYLRIAERVFLGFGGRPHWGKLHTRDAADLRTRYPRFDDFLAVRSSLDPEGVLRNPHLDRVLGPV